MTMKFVFFWRSRSKLSDKANGPRIFVIWQMTSAFAIALIFFSSLLLQTRYTYAQNSKAEDDRAVIENAGVPVEIDGRPILVVYANIAGITPQERAQAIQQRITALAGRKDVALATVHVENRGTWSEIVAGGERIMGITETDAQGAEQNRVELATEYAEAIRQAMQQYRSEHTWWNFFLGCSYTAMATLGVGGLFVILVKMRRVTRPKIELWTRRFETESSIKSARIRLRRYVTRSLIAIGQTLFWILFLGLIQAYGTLVLRFFPATRYTSYQITNWLFSELAGVGKIVIECVPPLQVVLIIFVITSYHLDLSEDIFCKIVKEKLTFRSFYRA